MPFGPYDDMRLREWCYGDLEGEPGELLHATLDVGFGAPLSFEEHNRRLPEVADVLADADCSGRAERFDAIERRLRGFFREAGDAELRRDGGNVLVVTHSFVVRTLVYLIDPERVNDPVKIPNASVTRISYDGSDFPSGRDRLHRLATAVKRKRPEQARPTASERNYQRSQLMRQTGAVPPIAAVFALAVLMVSCLRA